ncbi:MAG: hypothetical protein WCV67_03190 [Victivallaceae bacterium]|jgi:hypothetical protein
MNFIIRAPHYRNSSAGIRVLHRLAELLNQAGYNAICTKQCQKIKGDTIVIYPEITRGNPFKAKYIVRYILNAPGRLGGPSSFAKSDLLVAYSPDLSGYAQGEILTVNVIEDFFCYNGETKSLDYFYKGKGINTEHPAIQGLAEITPQWPASRLELSDILKKTRTLYTYDNYTCLISEAIRCGCNVMYVHPDHNINPVQLFDGDLDYSKESDQVRRLIQRCLKLINH